MSGLGDMELDICHRIVELAGSRWVLQGPRRNLWQGPEQPPDGVVPVVASFVEISGLFRIAHNDGDVRDLQVQVLHRFAKGPSPRERQAAKALMGDLYGALHRTLSFTGVATEATYLGILCVDLPFVLEDRYVSLNLTVTRDG